jgi:hypothetical protein
MSRHIQNTTSIQDLFDIEEEEKNVNKYNHYMKAPVSREQLLNPNYQYEEQPSYQQQQPIQIPQQMPIINKVEETCNLHCKDILNHIKECEICHKFYNNDRSIYIILLVLFGLIIVILMKKVMEK